MAEFGVNKGVGKEVEFKGLTTQYLFIFAGGLIGVFILVVILNLSGLNNFSCILFGIVAGSVLVWGVFHLNNKYGPHGLMKRMALKQHPRRIIHRRSIRAIIQSLIFQYARKIQNIHFGAEISASGRRKQLHHIQKRGHHSRISRRPSRTLHHHGRRVRGYARSMTESPESPPGLHDRSQTRLFYRRALPSGG